MDGKSWRIKLEEEDYLAGGLFDRFLALPGMDKIGELFD